MDVNISKRRYTWAARQDMAFGTLSVPLKILTTIKRVYIHLHLLVLSCTYQTNRRGRKWTKLKRTCLVFSNVTQMQVSRNVRVDSTLEKPRDIDCNLCTPLCFSLGELIGVFRPWGQGGQCHVGLQTKLFRTSYICCERINQAPTTSTWLYRL